MDTTDNTSSVSNLFNNEVALTVRHSEHLRPFYKILEAGLLNSSPSNFNSSSESLLQILDTNFPDFVSNLNTWWKTREQHILKLMENTHRNNKQENNSDKVLIEIAAQHPLKDGQLPDSEFINCLEKGIELFTQLSELGNEVLIYVPGNRHQQGDNIDIIPLSEAGKNYLIGRGIPPTSIHGEDWNQKYKGVHSSRQETIRNNSGVYCSADECLVTAQAFMDERCNRAIAVLSKNQQHRKWYHYIAFGILPEIVSVTPLEAFHNAEFETKVIVPFVKYIDPFVQSPSSILANCCRNISVPQDSRTP